jgi:hypothetical protein
VALIDAAHLLEAPVSPSSQVVVRVDDALTQNAILSCDRLFVIAASRSEVEALSAAPPVSTMACRSLLPEVGIGLIFEQRQPVRTGVCDAVRQVRRSEDDLRANSRVSPITIPLPSSTVDLVAVGMDAELSLPRLRPHQKVGSRRLTFCILSGQKRACLRTSNAFIA